MTSRTHAERRIPHVDAMRAGAVLLVVGMHAGLGFLPGDGGVTVFFVISGFVITRVLLAERDGTGGFNARQFYRRRLYKLGPPFVIAVLLPSLVFGALRGIDWAALAAQIGFSYNWMQVFSPLASEHVLPGSDVVWSLAIEEQFYLAFAVIWALLLARRTGLAAVALVAGLAAVGSLATRCLLAWGEPGDPRFWDDSLVHHVTRGTDTRIEGIALGILVALVQHRFETGSRPWSRLGSPVVLVAAALLMASGSLFFRGDWTEVVFRPTVQSAASALLILYGLHARSGRTADFFHAVSGWKPVQAIGLASYSIYLVHNVLFHALDPALSWMPIPVSVPMALVLGVAAGLLMYRWIEIPTMQFRRSRDRVGALEPSAS